ncbi:uncharacterized protein LOC142220638 [Haematobia irritans]|uniref:uncharacterized protein LOC142220638 n=1 Tax=Haematobia irritans TaxID=7368 RepID=UPI003F508661
MDSYNIRDQFREYHINKKDETLTCMSCEANEHLWACLSCVHIGCSRIQKGHAYSHYQRTQHKYCIEFGKFLVWDYERKCVSKDGQQLNARNPLESNKCSCPICRYHQIPKLINSVDSTTCMACDNTANLWLCLDCNHIGCGRQSNGHALDHYNISKHSRVMNLINFSIWNYKEEKYDHRPFDGLESSVVAVTPEEFTKDQLRAQNSDGLEERIKYLEHEWKNFCKLKETNRQMISIEQRLIALSEEKMLLECKLKEHDTKLNELLHQLKDDNQNQLYSPTNLENKDIYPLPPMSSSFSTVGRPNDNKPIVSLTVSDNLEQTQLIIFFILLLFFYHFVNLFVQGIIGKA